MELKLIFQYTTGKDLALLIVPYGIETRFRLRLPFLGFLLIVPYGIETNKWSQINPSALFF